jgi:hypothetical protein
MASMTCLLSDAASVPSPSGRQDADVTVTLTLPEQEVSGRVLRRHGRIEQMHERLAVAAPN